MLFGGTKTCRYERCLKQFTPSKFAGTKQRFCSERCRVNWNYKHKFYPRHRQPKAFVTRICQGCSRSFEMVGRGRGSGRQRYCNKKCLKEAEARRKRAARKEKK